MAELAEVARDDPDRFNAGLGYLLLTAWARYERAAEVPTGSDVHPSVEKAVRLLRDGEGGDLSVDEIGRRCGRSGAHLARLFRAQTGVSLVAFRNRQRLDRFLRLYGRGHRGSMLQAALDAGFGRIRSSTAFSPRRWGGARPNTADNSAGSRTDFPHR
jgi:transcriptional regulator GlxA family with amidase domain